VAPWRWLLCPLRHRAEGDIVTMGVKKNAEILKKVAWLWVNKKVNEDMLCRAALLYSEAKKKARDRRDRWKMKKRLNNAT
jgi:hypothetical protein